MNVTMLAPELRHQDDTARSHITTSAGIVIGGAWTPRMPALTSDAEQLQAALLDRRTAARRPLLMRMAGVVWGWL